MTEPQTQNGTALVEIQSVKKYFPIRKGVLSREVARVHAVDDVTLSVAEGETLGLVGESGCGKSTLGRCIVRLLEPTAGDIVFDGRSIGKLGARKLRPIRRQMQMIFQDPYASLNPRKRVGTIISDPMKIHGIGDRKERKKKVEDLLESLQTQFDLTYLFIAHDLSVVRHISDLIAVMYLGSIVEISPAEALYDNPLHPYTISLLSAVPIPDPDVEAKRETILLPGELPSPVNPPAACRFHTRCPYVQPTRCTTEVPELRKLGDGHFVSCHWAEKIKAGAIEPIESTPLEAERQDAPVE